jgi:hypothetical protein
MICEICAGKAETDRQTAGAKRALVYTKLRALFASVSSRL